MQISSGKNKISLNLGLIENIEDIKIKKIITDS